MYRRKLFGVVYIPEAVYRELTENEVFSEEVRIVKECEFFYVEEVDTLSTSQPHIIIKVKKKKEHYYGESF